jgi:L-2-hydroxyglutarate oxidase
VHYDFCVVGGGIVGLASALALLRRKPGASLLLLEKEQELAAHQTGHNSGVIHTGIYYAPGSLKAELCRRGAEITKAFATEHNVAFEVCGKLLVATNAVESARMDALYDRAVSNGVEVERIDRAELRRREPAVDGVGALFVPGTGIIDYVGLSRAFADQVRELGGQIEVGMCVDGLREDSERVSITAGSQQHTATRLAVCAGLQADRLARLAGLAVTFQIVPFRGEYYRLPACRAGLVNRLIYPIPDPDLPFLGVHITRMIDGSVTVGPNAVLGLAREGYPKGSVAWRDVAEYVRFPGMWQVARHNIRNGLVELRNSLFKRGYLQECRKYCPTLTADDLLPAAAGIRAQAVLRDGTLVHDFLFRSTPRSLHVCNAPSPAATSAIPIGEMIADRLLAQN